MDVIELIRRPHFLRLPVGHPYLWQGADGLTLIDTGMPGSGALITSATAGSASTRADLRQVTLTHFHERSRRCCRRDRV
jgi:glyoxylase-like metal-dependent hydrolase (beta-lactamase superfamily II)